MIEPDRSSPILVWDGCVRVSHWLLAAAIAMAWLSTLGWGFVSLHEPAGYLVLAVLAVRIGWGMVGPRYARFSQFVRAPIEVSNYLGLMMRGREPRFLGHNPAGGWMIVALLVCAAATALTGWLFNTDTFWGIAWMMQLHVALAWTLLVLIPLHVVGVIFTSVRQRENLLRSMLTGRKAQARNGDIS